MADHGPNSEATALVAHEDGPAPQPLQRKARFTLARGLLLLAVISASAAGCGTHSTTTPKTSGASSAAAPAPSSTPNPTAPPSTGPTAKLPVQSGDWRLDSVVVDHDGQGDFVGTAQVTYTGAEPHGGHSFFTVQLSAHGKAVSALVGTARGVLPGRPASLQLISQEKFVNGPYTYQFADR